MLQQGETLALDLLAVVAVGAVLLGIASTGKAGYAIAVSTEVVALVYLAGTGALNAQAVSKFVARIGG